MAAAPPTVTTKRVSDLIRAIDDGSLHLRPNFQRRLVWTNKVKDHFLETVTLGLPFPEVFWATGQLDHATMARQNLLVDGQQRISTLREYVHGSKDLILEKVKPYNDLTPAQKTAFLDYPVVVRDLGSVSPKQIKDIFARINSTDYSLKAMERLNALYNGEYKKFCDVLARDRFFEEHDVFSMTDHRRMRDLDFAVILVTTLLSTYYQRDQLNRDYLHRYNDSFPKAKSLKKQIKATLDFVESCGFPKKCRVWKKTDLFTLIVEIHSLLANGGSLDPKKVGAAFTDFYGQVDSMFAMKGTDAELEAAAPSPKVFRYLKAATKATNDKYARLDRANIVAELLKTAVIDNTTAGSATKKKKAAKKTPLAKTKSRRSTKAARS